MSDLKQAATNLGRNGKLSDLKQAACKNNENNKQPAKDDDSARLYTRAKLTLCLRDAVALVEGIGLFFACASRSSTIYRYRPEDLTNKTPTQMVQNLPNFLLCRRDVVSGKVSVAYPSDFSVVNVRRSLACNGYLAQCEQSSLLCNC